MKIKPYVDKLYSSGEYKDFAKEHKDAYITAGFFVLDLEAGKHIHQIDFYVPKEKKVAAFTLDHGVTMQMMKLMNSKVPEKLDLQVNIDLAALKGILDEEMKNRNITEEIKKIIAVLQNLDGKKIWNINCVLSGMGILRAHIEDSSKSVLKMEKASIMDYIKKMSPQDIQKMSAQARAAGAGGAKAPTVNEEGEVEDEGQSGSPQVQISSGQGKKPDVKDKLKQLQVLEDEIEKEKKNILSSEAKPADKIETKAEKKEAKSGKKK